MSFLLEKKGWDLQPSSAIYVHLPRSTICEVPNCGPSGKVTLLPLQMMGFPSGLEDNYSMSENLMQNHWQLPKPPSFWVYPPFDRPSNCLLDMSSNSRIVTSKSWQFIKATTRTLFLLEGQTNTESWHGSIHNVESLEAMTSVTHFYGSWSYASNHYRLPTRAPHVASG